MIVFAISGLRTSRLAGPPLYNLRLVLASTSLRCSVHDYISNSHTSPDLSNRDYPHSGEVPADDVVRSADRRLLDVWLVARSGEPD